MMYSNIGLGLLLPLALGAASALPIHLGGLKGFAAAYPDCGPDHLGDADRVQLKQAIVKAVGPRVPPDPIGGFFEENVVIVAPAQLHKGERNLIAYLSGDGYCGTGGCNGYVLERHADHGTGQPKYELVTEIEPARVPMFVLPTVHNGWHDIGVVVAGGGHFHGCIGALSFDGKSYDSNPTLSDIPHVKEAIGEVVLGPPGASPGQCRLR